MKKKFGSMGVAEVLRLKQLEDENSKPKRLVADLSLDKAILQDVLRKESGWLVNHKRSERLYRLEGLYLRRIRPRRRKSVVTRGPVVVGRCTIS